MNRDRSAARTARSVAVGIAAGAAIIIGATATADAQTRLPREQIIIRTLEQRGLTDIRIIDRTPFQAIVEWCDDGAFERHRIDGQLRSLGMRDLGACDAGLGGGFDDDEPFQAVTRRAIRRDLTAMGFGDVDFERFRERRGVATLTACRAGATYELRYSDGTLEEIYRTGECGFVDPYGDDGDDGDLAFGGGDDFDLGDDDLGGGGLGGGLGGDFVSPASFVDDIAAFGYREVSFDGRLGRDFLFSACYGARRFLMRVDREGEILAQRIDRQREFCSVEGFGLPSLPERPSDDVLEGAGPLTPAQCQHALNWLSFNETYRIGFQPQRFELREDMQQLVSAMAANFQRCRGVRRVFVDGHTDSRGDPDANNELSERRARSVARVLRDNGVEAGIIIVQGHGADHPVATNDTTDGRERNRRIEINLEWGRMQP